MAPRRPSISIQERRARIVVRHHLSPSTLASSVPEAAGDLVGLHATDPRSVYLAAWARVRDASVATVERELFEERRAIRMLGMRRTMFVLPVELAGVVHAACSLDVAARERRRLLGRLEANGVAKNAQRWLARVEASTVRALAARGEATATELAQDVPELGTRIRIGRGTRFETSQSVSLWVLLVLAAEGRIVRGRPRGSWVSRQYRWAPMEAWVPGGLPQWSTDHARAELVRRWLASFGPGRFEDLKWWTGLTAGAVRAALDRVRPVEVDLEGAGSGLALPGDVGRTRRPRPGISLLPPLDQTVMGWTERRWFLGAHRAALFDRSGNAGPTVWWDGRVVGGWAQRRSGEIAVRFLEDVGREARRAAEEAAGRLRAWLGDTRVIPAFRTPLEREITDST
jgi:hypothetical protein